MSLRFSLRLLAALACGLFATLLFAAPASAHAALERTDPVAGVILEKAPREVTLTFSEGVSPVSGAVTVVAPDGKAVNVGKPSQHDGDKQLVLRLRAGLAKGTYLVSYRVVSADGHPVGGGYTFSVIEPSKPAAAPPSSGEAPVDDAVQTALFYGKYAGYAGASMLAGAVLVLLTLWPRRLGRKRLTAIGYTGWVLLFNGTLVGLYAQVPYGNGGKLTDFDATSLRETLTSTLGIAGLARLALLAAALPLLVKLFRAGELPPWGRWALVGMGAVSLFTWPFYGHAAVAPGKYLAIPADAVHVGAMAIWLGGLLVLASTLLVRGRAKELPLVLAVWSRWAFYAVMALAFTGIVQALLEVGPLLEIFSHTFGRVVVFKAVGLLLIVGVAAASRHWVRTRAPELSELDDDERAASVGVLRRRVGLELGLAAVVLGLAAFLTQTPPGYSDERAQAKGDLPYSTTINSDAIALQVDIDPARKGNNTLHLTAFDKSGKALKVVEWRATAALPAKNLAAVDIPLLALSDNHVQGQIFLPSPGQWEFRFVVRTSDVDQVTLKRVVPIA